MKKVVFILFCTATNLIMLSVPAFAQWTISGSNAIFQSGIENAVINGTTPLGDLTVRGGTSSPGATLAIQAASGASGWDSQISFYSATPALRHVIYDDFSNGKLSIYCNYGGGADDVLRVWGSVEIGEITMNNPTGYRLYVAEGILTEKVKVAVRNSTAWADYVFDDNYPLRSIHDVEKFIFENKHLPDVPSAEEVVANGINMAEMDATLLRKIEELTLYLIESEKRIKALENEIQVMKQNSDK